MGAVHFGLIFDLLSMPMKRTIPSIAFLLLLSMLTLSNSVSAQKSAKPLPLTWELLADVSFTDSYLPEMGTTYQIAKFGRFVESMEGKEVMIIGYLLPLDIGGDQYALSATPFATCFFCGGGGPETVLELRLAKKEPWFEMDQLVQFQGTLILNSDSPSSLYYILEDAVAVERLDK